LNVGTTGSFTVTVIEYGRAHSLASGVKVYVKFPAVAVESIPGFHVPFTPLSEVVGNMTCSNTSFKQNGPAPGNVGVTGWLTVTVIVAVVAHCPAVGVNVYVVVAVLFTAGDHVPFIPFNEAVGSVNDPPLQIAATCVNVGVTGWLTVTDIVAVVAQVPAVGVNIYVVVAVLFTAGDHVPLIAFNEAVGSVNDPPLQIGATCVNVGVMFGFTVTLIVVVVAQAPVAGVKVYVVVAVLFTAGDHVPLIAFNDVVGSEIVPPLQIGATCVNVGVTGGPTLTVIVAVVAH
jgi:hypothetical protein